LVRHRVSFAFSSRSSCLVKGLPRQTSQAIRNSFAVQLQKAR
jgi:hypothetical protein